MNGRYLLDTNIIIALFAQEETVRQRLSEASEVLVSCIVMGELYYGAQKSTHAMANVRRIDDLALTSTMLGYDLETARHYGRIKNQLRAKGRPIPENDIWLAALAAQHRLTLVTRDDHFDEIDTISTESW